MLLGRCKYEFEKTFELRLNPRIYLDNTSKIKFHAGLSILSFINHLSAFPSWSEKVPTSFAGTLVPHGDILRDKASFRGGELCPSELAVPIGGFLYFGQMSGTHYCSARFPESCCKCLISDGCFGGRVSQDTRRQNEFRRADFGSFGVFEVALPRCHSI